MSEPFDIEQIRRNLSAAMARQQVKPTTLSLLVGNSPTLVKDLLEKSGDPKISTLSRLANALKINVGDLLADAGDVSPIGPTLYVKGEVAAGSWVDAYEWPQEDWQALTGRPDVSADIMHRFFLRVTGDSMDQVYPDGTFVECVSVFGHTEIAPGKRVVVLRRRDDQLVEATVKELVEQDGALWFAPKSSNPAHQAFRADEPMPGIEEVQIIAVVVSSFRPE